MGFKGFKKPKSMKELIGNAFLILLGVIVLSVGVWAGVASTVFHMRHPNVKQGDINWIDVMTFGWTAED